VEESSHAIEVGSVAVKVSLDLPLILGRLELASDIAVNVPVS